MCDILDNVLLKIKLLWRRIVGTNFTDLLNSIGGWGVDWRTRALAAEAVAEAEKERADAAVAALETALAEDAVTDAAQIEEAVTEAVGEANAAAQAKWDELQALDVPPSVPDDNTDPDTGLPVVDEPHVDNTLPTGEPGTSPFNS